MSEKWDPLCALYPCGRKGVKWDALRPFEIIICTEPRRIDGQSPISILRRFKSALVPLPLEIYTFSHSQRQARQCHSLPSGRRAVMSNEMV
jgi:hypothetical protein